VGAEGNGRVVNEDQRDEKNPQPVEMVGTIHTI
jgi:hypothetical protein